MTRFTYTLGLEKYLIKKKYSNYIFLREILIIGFTLRLEKEFIGVKTIMVN